MDCTGEMVSIVNNVYVNASSLFKGDYDISTDVLPSGAFFGYEYFTRDTHSVGLMAHDGNPIPEGCIMRSIKVGSEASTTDITDWIFIPTQF